MVCLVLVQQSPHQQGSVQPPVMPPPRLAQVNSPQKIFEENRIVFSLKCREEEEREFGERVEMNQTALETIKLFHDKREMSDFLSSSQVVKIALSS